MTVSVTDDDIRKGWKWSWVRCGGDNRRCAQCPVALALARATRKKCLAYTYWLHVGGSKHRTPEAVSDWMMDFDYGKDVKPFQFEIPA
jgi:hypothetical protein